MNEFSDAIVYLNDPYNWTSSGGIADLALEHIEIAAVAVLAAMVIALPIGIALGTSGRGSGVVIVLSNVSRAVPTLALLTLFAVSPIGFGDRATTIALALFAIPPILTNTFVGFRGVDADVREAARGMGYGPARMLVQVDLPLALPAFMAGLRIATVSTVALTTVGVLVGHGGLGQLIVGGFNANFYRAEIVTGTVGCVLLALLADLLLAGAERLLTPWSRVARA